MTTTMPTMVATRMSPPTASTRPRSSVVDRVLLGLESFLALASGAGALGLIVGWIDLAATVDRIPFDSPVVGGVALAVIVTLPSVVAVVAAATHQEWAPLAHLAVGLTLCTWIVVQVLFIGFASVLQPAMFLFGVLLLMLGSRTTVVDEAPA
jgi:hypothetical protein